MTSKGAKIESLICSTASLTSIASVFIFDINYAIGGILSCFFIVRSMILDIASDVLKEIGK